MKIVFTGGGTGGHFYPIIAVAEEINDLVKENKLVKPEMFYFSNSPYNPGLLYENNIEFVKISAGKLRIYFSLLNILDLFKTFLGVLGAVWKLFKIYPDVVFSKGGYASFPTVLAARILRIPVVLHESDSVPGRVNILTAKFAEKIAVSYKECSKFFPKEKVAFTGNPIRKEVSTPLSSGAYEFLGLKKDLPVILVLGGSLGSNIINNTIIDSLNILLPKYQIIHQTGKANIVTVRETANVVISDKNIAVNYKPFDYLNLLSMRMAAGVSSIVISRAGSTIFEIANWSLPSIIIPITNSHGNHQRENAYAYARTGSCEVIEEANLTSHLLSSEIDRIVSNQKIKNDMIMSTKSFIQNDASKNIATEILNIALGHEK